MSSPSLRPYPLSSMENLPPGRRLHISCKTCSMEYIGVSSHESRLFIQTHKRPHSYLCHHCNRHFADLPDIITHREIAHDIKSFSCKSCPYIARSSIALDKHIIKKHQELIKNSNFTCGGCKKKFKDPTALKRHESKVCKIELFFCSICNFCGQNQAKLTQHEWRVHKKKHFSCDKCSKTYMTYAGLKKHQETHSDGYCRKYFICDFCGKVLSYMRTFKQHILSHIDGSKVRKDKEVVSNGILQGENEFLEMACDGLDQNGVLLYDMGQTIC